MDRLGDGLVYLCRASGEGSHDFRVCCDEASVGAFYQEMTGEDEGGGIDSLWRDFRNPDCWDDDGTALELELYCAKFEVWKVDARQLTVAQSAGAGRDAERYRLFRANVGREIVASRNTAPGTPHTLRINLDATGCERYTADGAVDFPATIDAILDDEARIRASWERK